MEWSPSVELSRLLAGLPRRQERAVLRIVQAEADGTPLIRLLKIDDSDGEARELIDARKLLAEVALKRLAQEPDSEETGVKRIFELERDAWAAGGVSAERDRWKKLIRLALDAQRAELGRLHEQYDIREETFLILQEELDWRQLSLTAADAQAIEET